MPRQSCLMWHSRARWRPGGWTPPPYGTPVLEPSRRCHGVASPNLARVCYNLRPMAALHRMRVAWSGAGVVGPGVTTFFVDPAVQEFVPDQVKTFFSSIAVKFPNTVTWTIPNNGDSIEETTGALLGSWSVSGGGTVTGGATGASFAEGVGARVKWNTGTIVGKRRLHGATFLVPLANTCFQSSGQLDPAAATTFQNAAQALVTAHGGALAVWHRPKKGTGPTGSHGPITTAQVPLNVSWLKTRKV